MTIFGITFLTKFMIWLFSYIGNNVYKNISGFHHFFKNLLICEYFNYFLLKFYWPFFFLFKLTRSSLISDFAWTGLLFLCIVIVMITTSDKHWLTDKRYPCEGWGQVLVLSCERCLKTGYISMWSIQLWLFSCYDNLLFLCNLITVAIQRLNTYMKRTLEIIQLSCNLNS